MSLQSNTQKTVVVLGMHRSGTSAITNVLYAAGLYCGRDKDLLPGTQFNEKGYFEHREVMRINEDILLANSTFSTAETGANSDSYHEIQLTDYGWIYGAYPPSTETLLMQPGTSQRLTQYIDSVYELAGNKSIAIKDPRFSLTLPVWAPFLRNYAVIIMVRDPDEVSQSLFLRDDLPFYISQRLWTFYNHSALRVTAGAPRIILNYKDLVSHPDETVRTLFDFLELNGIDNIRHNFGDAVSAIVPHLSHKSAVRKLPVDQLTSSDCRQYFENILQHAKEPNQVKFPSDNSPENNSIDKWWLIATYTFLVGKIRNIQITKKRDASDLKYSRLLQHYNRLLRHPVSGMIIRLLRFLKRDDSFGGRPEK